MKQMTEEEYQRYKENLFRDLRIRDAMDLLGLKTVKIEDIAEFTGFSTEHINTIKTYNSDIIAKNSFYNDSDDRSLKHTIEKMKNDFDYLRMSIEEINDKLSAIGKK